MSRRPTLPQRLARHLLLNFAVTMAMAPLAGVWIGPLFAPAPPARYVAVAAVSFVVAVIVTTVGLLVFMSVDDQ